MTDLALYFHIPFCRRRCCYCSFASTAGREADIPNYIQAIINEIGLRRRRQTQVKTIYFGGGTPSLLTIPQVKKILAAVRENYAVAKNAEITLEANPGTIDDNYLHLLREGGVNRLSIGMQSLDDAELKFLERVHTVAEAIESIGGARRAGFTNLSLDFIYGVPGRKNGQWSAMLKNIIDLKAEHLSLYALSLEEGTALAGAAERGEVAIPDPDTTAQEYELACILLEQAGYRQYEISNWARPGYKSRHNLTYWTGGDYIGLGWGAHSFLGGARYTGTDDLDGYLETLGARRLNEQRAEKLEPAVALGEAMMLGLRLNVGVGMDDIKARFKIDLQEHFRAEIAELAALGLVEWQEGRLKLTLRGRLLGNEVFIRFLP